MLRMFGFGHPSGRAAPAIQCQQRCYLQVEELEPRTLLDAYAPSQIRHAYGFDQLPYDGTGQTIAIVVAYDNAALSYDLGEFDQLFGLPDPVLTIAQPQGQPTTDPGWGLEAVLDVEWAHAIAPAANILLVEARTPSFSNMMAAVDYARQQPGVVVVSMSWAYGDFSTEARFDYHFTTPSGHIGGSGLSGGITFVAASGDSGAGADWPAISPNVLSIGGTTLTLDTKNQILSEIGWSESGGGVSNYESQPDYQAAFQTFGMRTTPDFSYDADPSTAYWVYSSSNGGMLAVYGTSAGAPQWAALIALIDQGLATNNVGSLDGATQTIPALYNLANVSYATYYNDIVDGNNGYAAGPGYDLVTGIGSPVVDQVVQGLVNGAQGPSGGARGPNDSRGRPFSGTRLTSTAIAPPSPPQHLAITAPLGTIPHASLRERDDSINPSAGLLLAAVSNSEGTTSPEGLDIGFPAIHAVQAGSDGDGGADHVLLTAPAPRGLPENEVKNSNRHRTAIVDDPKHETGNRVISGAFDGSLGIATVVLNGLAANARG